MAKRRTSQVQRRPRASQEAMTRRAGASSRSALDWRIVAIAAAILAAVAIVIVALLVSNGGDPRFKGIAKPIEGRNHVPVGQFPTYRSVPPTSGDHWSSANPLCPMNWGVYTSPVEEPCAVHNLEHGGIVIWYTSSLPADQVTKLTDFVNAQLGGAQFKFVLSPWAGKDFGHPIALTAWGWVLYLDTADTDAIQSFSSQHYGRAPEPNGGPAAPG
jgi:hypothetical protein